MSKIKLSKEFIKSTVKLALNEDLYPSGDITSSLIKDDKIVTAKLIANQSVIDCEATGLCENFNIGPIPQNQPQD